MESALCSLRARRLQCDCLATCEASEVWEIQAMTASDELESPDGVTNSLLEQIKSGFSGKLRVTITTLPADKTGGKED